MKTVVAGALGECVHVAGVMNFLNLAELAGWRTVFLGPAVPLEEFLRAAREEHAAPDTPPSAAEPPPPWIVLPEPA